PVLCGAFVVLSILLSWLIPSYQGFWSQLTGGASVERIVRGVLICGIFVWCSSRLSRTCPPIMSQLGGMLVAAVLAFLLASVQTLPTAEFVAGSTRNEGGAGLNRYGFSLVPYRVAEFVWPSILGSPFPTNATWRSVLTPRGDPTFWVPSLYIGGLPFVLACIATFKGRQRACRWLTLLVV